MQGITSRKSIAQLAHDVMSGPGEKYTAQARNFVVLTNKATIKKAKTIDFPKFFQKSSLQ